MKSTWDPAIVKTAQALGLTPEMFLAEPARYFHTMICAALQCDPSRLVTCEAVPVDMPGKTGLHLDFQPELSDGERRVLGQFLIALSKITSTNPPI